MKFGLSLCFMSAILSCSVPASGAEPGESGAAAPVGKALSMLGTAIPVSDLDRSLAFYTKGLGLQATPRRDAGEVVEEPLTFPGGGAYLILLWKKVPSTPGTAPPETRRVILRVPDLKALAAQLEANGFHLKGPINDSPQHHYAVAHIDDPDGNHFELVQHAD